jgi:hypothetical protein
MAPLKLAGTISDCGHDFFCGKAEIHCLSQKTIKKLFQPFSPGTLGKFGFGLGDEYAQPGLRKISLPQRQPLMLVLFRAAGS